MNQLDQAAIDDLVEVRNPQAGSSVVIVCEHASAHIPPEFDHLGLAAADRKSHVVWDPGALALSDALATNLDAVLVSARTSRLIYDCNRPPDAPDAMPTRSEIIDVPGNVGLTPTQKADRVARYYEPFREKIANVLANTTNPILLTIHSFTPVFHGALRDVEIGVLHDADARLADALLEKSDMLAPHIVKRNAPYGPADGVTHTLKAQALPAGHLNVMLEVRNDLIIDETAQTSMAKKLAAWLTAALSKAGATTCKP